MATLAELSTPPTPRQLLAAARYRAVQKAPYLAHALLSMIPHEVPEIEGQQTMALTEAWVLLWSPGALTKWSREEAAAVLVHEVSHGLHAHFRRARAAGVPEDDAQLRTLWNLAADAAINDGMRAGKYGLPGEAVYPETFGARPGLTAEEYYRILRELPAPPGGSRGVTCGCCGSAAGNPVGCEPSLVGGSSKGDGAGGDLPRGRSPVEQEHVRRQTAQAVRDAVGRGSVPAGWQRWADEMLRPPVVPWPRLLERAIRRGAAAAAGAVVTTYGRPSRRQSGLGYGPGRAVLPAYRGVTPRVAVGLDTSGSMGERELRDALSECAGILRTVGADVLFCACDAAVHALVRVRHTRDLAAHLRGGGGTDFGPIFAAVGASKFRPDVLVILTDGCGPAPAAPPRWLRVIWVLVGACQRVPYTHLGEDVSYGTFVRVPVDSAGVVT